MSTGLKVKYSSYLDEFLYALLQDVSLTGCVRISVLKCLQSIVKCVKGEGDTLNLGVPDFVDSSYRINYTGLYKYSNIIDYIITINENKICSDELILLKADICSVKGNKVV